LDLPSLWPADKQFIWMLLRSSIANYQIFMWVFFFLHALWTVIILHDFEWSRCFPPAW
jgi:hypothetical protein